MPVPLQQIVSFGSILGNTPVFSQIDTEQILLGHHLVAMETEATDPDSGRILSAKMTWEKKEGKGFRAGGGRLGVLIPTLNCRDQLPAQVEIMSKWLDLVDEIVVIDGGSSDGTVEFLEEQLGAHPRIRIVRHPRGLWQGWNAGLALMTTKYVLIATAGDMMGREGIEHLLDVIETTDADIVLSPPQLKMYDGSLPPKEDWPIHEVITRLKIDCPVIIPHDLLMGMTFLFAAWGQGILGSSASNLYRTELLQSRPFPTDCGCAGDVAWGLRNMSCAKVAVTNHACASFTCHPANRLIPSLEEMWRPACVGAGVNLSFETFFRKHLDLKGKEILYFSKLAKIQKRYGSAWRLHPHSWLHRLWCAWFSWKKRKGFFLGIGYPDYFKIYVEQILFIVNIRGLQNEMSLEGIRQFQCGALAHGHKLESFEK